MIPIGYVRRAHGIGGAVLVRPLSDDAGRRYAPGEVLRTDEEPERSLKIRTASSHKDGILVSFDGVSGRGEAEAMQGVSFLIAASERRALQGDEYWEDDLVGLRVVGSGGVDLGVITAVVFGAAQDRLVVETADGSSVEVPFVAAIAVTVDVPDGKVVMDPPDGLF